MRTFLLAAAAAAALAFAAPSPADILHLKNGNKVEGKVVKETDTDVKLETPVGTVTFKRDDIDRIERGISPLEQYQRTLDTLKDGDTVKHYYLGLWCKEKGLRRQAEDEFRRVIAVNPDHAEARKELGYEMHEGKWMTKDEAMVAKGFVLHEGRWISGEEAEKVKDTQQRREWREKLLKAAAVMCTSKPEPGRKVFESIDSPDNIEGGADAVIPGLNTISEHKCAAAREAAISALGRLRTPAAIDGIVEAALNERDPEVQQTIAGQMKAVGSYRCATLLAKALRQLRMGVLAAANEDKPKMVAAMVRCSEVLGMLGEGVAVPELAASLVMRIDYYREVDSASRVTGATDTSFDTKPIRVRNGAAIVETATSKSVSISTMGTKTEFVPDFYNDKAAAALKKITGKSFDFDTRKWLEWWAKNKPILPPEE